MMRSTTRPLTSLAVLLLLSFSGASAGAVPAPDALDPGVPGTRSAAPLQDPDTVPEPEEEEPDPDEGLPLEPARTLSVTLEEGTWLSLDVSPDGGTIVFELLGDLYTVPIVMKNGRLYEGDSLDEVWPRERALERGAWVRDRPDPGTLPGSSPSGS